MTVEHVDDLQREFTPSQAPLKLSAPKAFPPSHQALLQDGGRGGPSG